LFNPTFRCAKTIRHPQCWPPVCSERRRVAEDRVVRGGDFSAASASKDSARASHFDHSRASGPCNGCVRVSLCSRMGQPASHFVPRSGRSTGLRPQEIRHRDGHAHCVPTSPEIAAWQGDVRGFVQFQLVAFHRFDTSAPLQRAVSSISPPLVSVILASSIGSPETDRGPPRS
jgi:hypothetical protein